MKRSSHGAAGGASKRRCKGIAVVQLGGGEAKPRQAALWRQGLLCDVQLRVGNEVFPAHRLVLAAESTFLAALFTGHFKDSLAPLVDIHEMAPRIFALALDYMYDGTCAVPDITSLQKLLSVASVLQIDSLFAAAAATLEEHISVDNCVTMLVCADQHNTPQLALKAEDIASNAFVDVASDPAVPASSMVALLQSDHLNVTSEEQVFETLSTWLKGQAEPLGEEKQLNMFGLVRFTLLSQDFLDSTVMSEPVFSSLRAHKLLLTQFQQAFLGGEKSTQRGKHFSEILSNEAHRQILSWLDMGAETKLELLYRASNDGWSGEDFHSKCDNKGPTVSVFKCTGGYSFGGFTSTPWASTNVFVACADSSAFVFSLHRPGGVDPVKLAVKTASVQFAIGDYSHFGPIFGSSDISLGTVNSDDIGSTNIHDYELPPGHAQVDAKIFFTGAKRFRAAEVEVFRVLV